MGLEIDARSVATPVEGELAADIKERAWVAGVQRSDVDAFEELFRRYCDELCGYAYSYLRSRDEARDVVQDLFLWIWDHRYEWQVSGSLRAYLFRSTHNRAFGRLRHRQLEHRFRENETAASEERVAPERTDATVEGQDLVQAIDRVVSALPERCRMVFILNRRHHLTYPQIAETLDISIKTVEAHMARALKALRIRLTDWLER